MTRKGFRNNRLRKVGCHLSGKSVAAWGNCRRPGNFGGLRHGTLLLGNDFRQGANGRGRRSCSLSSSEPAQVPQAAAAMQPAHGRGGLYGQCADPGHRGRDQRSFHQPRGAGNRMPPALWQRSARIARQQIFDHDRVPAVGHHGQPPRGRCGNRPDGKEFQSSRRAVAENAAAGTRHQAQSIRQRHHLAQHRIAEVGGREDSG